MLFSLTLGSLKYFDVFSAFSAAFFMRHFEWIKKSVTRFLNIVAGGTRQVGLNGQF